MATSLLEDDAASSSLVQHVGLKNGHLAAQTNLAVFLAEGFRHQWHLTLLLLTSGSLVSARRGVEQNKNRTRQARADNEAPSRLPQGKRLSEEVAANSLHAALNQAFIYQQPHRPLPPNSFVVLRP